MAKNTAKWGTIIVFFGLPSAADSLLDLHAVQEDHTVQSAAAEVQQAHLATLLGRSVKTWGPGDDMAGRHGDMAGDGTSKATSEAKFQEPSSASWRLKL